LPRQHTPKGVKVVAQAIAVKVLAESKKSAPDSTAKGVCLHPRHGLQTDKAVSLWPRCRLAPATNAKRWLS
jgi:hypothetical protein